MIKQSRGRRQKLCVYADSVLCVGQMRDIPEAIKRWKDQVEALTGCFRLTMMQWVSMEKQLNSSGKMSQDLHHCFRREIQQDLERKNIQPEEFKDRIIFMSRFNDI